MKTAVTCVDCGIESEASDRCPVCGRVAAGGLDALTNAVTAFRTWAEMVAAMSGGYAPTIHQDCRRKRLLTKVVRAAGFRVYLGGGQWAK
ncbi:hypothetical protein [Gemmata sp.]|uniref:hypothetical protein n=1 Tax=Gemmata sp. TaxID=1914242 RepID=UPI003F72ADF4